ncbi:MAG: hypothetical protein ABSF34_00930 [Verrucomicrobiota bacterium]|jgi:prepilin-type processing-associated H-X9-DG protein
MFANDNLALRRGEEGDFDLPAQNEFISPDMLQSVTELKPVTMAAFTLVELLLVCVVIAILVGLLMPVLARAKTRSQGGYCLNNVRQMTLAWTMYAGDNSGCFPANEESQAAADSDLPGWVKGNLDYSGSPDDTNISFLINPQYALLGSYLQSPGVFKCPSDNSLNYGQSGVPRVRSYSMNQAVGLNASGTPDGQGAWLPAPAFRVYFKEGDVVNPGPANLWLLTEESPDSINDAGFAFVMPPSAIVTKWEDVPSKCHGNTCPFSFADGHVETHRWLWPQVIPAVTYQELNKPLYALADPDILWVARHTSVPANGQALPY